jgi:hypothetical protein
MKLYCNTWLLVSVLALCLDDPCINANGYAGGKIETDISIDDKRRIMGKFDTEKECQEALASASGWNFNLYCKKEQEI